MHRNLFLTTWSFLTVTTPSELRRGTRIETGLFVKKLEFLLHGVEATDGSCWRMSGGVSYRKYIFDDTLIYRCFYSGVSKLYGSFTINDHVAQLGRYESASRVNLLYPTMGQLCWRTTVREISKIWTGHEIESEPSCSLNTLCRNRIQAQSADQSTILSRYNNSTATKAIKLDTTRTFFYFFV